MEFATLQQPTMQFLNHILSQSGVGALPYGESEKWKIRQQAAAALQHFPGLQAKATHYTYNDGRTSNLLLLTGTIPIHFHGSKYNIPVNIWLPEQFPSVAPIFYVTPTKEMVVKSNHKFVEPSGIVRMPYLNEWNALRSNLSELIQMASIVFSEEPPLFSRPLQHPNSNSNPSPSPTVSPYSGSTAVSSYGPRPVPSNLASSIFVTDSEPSESMRKAKLVKQLSEKVQGDLVLHQRLVSKELENLSGFRAELGQKLAQVERLEYEVQNEKEGLETRLQLLRTNAEILDEWLQRNEKGGEKIPPESLFLPVDRLSSQALEELSKDFALEDLMESLDFSMQQNFISGNKSLSHEVYLRQIRILAKEQFFHRAMVCRVKQLQLIANFQSVAQGIRR